MTPAMSRMMMSGSENFGQKLAPGRCLTRRGENVGAMLKAALHDLPVVEPRMARCVLHIFDDRKGLKIRKAGRT